jgi:hypothetical protein
MYHSQSLELFSDFFINCKNAFLKMARAQGEFGWAVAYPKVVAVRKP